MTHVPLIGCAISLNMCDMTSSYVWQDSFVCVTWRIRICVSHGAWHDCDMIHSHAYEWATSQSCHALWHDSSTHIWISHVTQSWCVTWLCHDSSTHIWMSHVTHSRCLTWLCHDSSTHIWMSHVTHSWCVTWLWHSSFIRVWMNRVTVMSRTIWVCDITHSYVICLWLNLRPTWICATWRIHKCDMTIHICSMTHGAWHDSYASDWLYNEPRHAWHDSFIRVTWPIYMRKMSYLWSWHYLTYSYTWDTYGVATISRLLKIVGLFCKEPYKRDSKISCLWSWQYLIYSYSWDTYVWCGYD